MKKYRRRRNLMSSRLLKLSPEQQRAVSALAAAFSDTQSIKESLAFDMADKLGRTPDEEYLMMVFIDQWKATKPGDSVIAFKAPDGKATFRIERKGSE